MGGAGGGSGSPGSVSHMQTALIDERELKLGIISSVPPDDLGAVWLQPS